MPYDEEVEARIRKIVTGWQNMSSKRMFGGVCHLLNGNMFCGVYKDFLILRLGVEKSAAAMQSPHVRPFDITGKPMKGWVMVHPNGFETDDALTDWLKQALDFAGKLPPR